MASCAMAWALNVECTPGELHNLVSGESFTALTITGSLDARDFKYISEQMPQLTSINLSQATIVKYKSAKPLFAYEVDYPGNVIPEMAFFDMNLHQVVLPANIKAIGTAAFAGCTNLTTITFPSGLETIADYAFSSTGIQNVTLPATIKSIGEGAFSKNTELVSVSIAPAATFIIAKNAFLGCSHLTNVTLGENVTVIEDYAFKGTTRLQQITFSGANNLQSIGKEAFLGSGITNFDFENSHSLTTIDEWAFAQSKQVSAKISNTTTKLEKGAFYYTTTLRSFFPNTTIDSISSMLLAGTAITNHDVLGEKVNRVGDYALYNTPAQAITVPSTTKYIGTKAMAGMTSLQSIESKATTVPRLGEEVWAGVNQQVIPLTVPTESFDDYANALQWQNFLLANQSVLGDVNQDGYVTSADVTAIYDILLGNSYQFEATADVNGDGSITAADITMVYNIILGVQNVPGRNQIVNDGKDKMKADGFTIEKGCTHELTIDLDNTALYTAMQLDVDMPQGLTIDDVTATSRTSGATIGFNELDNGKWRILIIKSSNTTINGNEGSLINIKVKASEDFGGNEIINFGNIIAVEPSEKTHMIGELAVEVSNTTGVKDISIDTSDNGPVDVYSVNGQLLRKGVDRDQATQGLPAGVYIVGGKKVLVR